MHALADAAFLHLLPSTLKPAQVRSAMTCLIKRQLKSKDNFDEKGWLKVGFTGSQIDISETYINTGSVYLCCAVFLPLGLPDSDPFWSAPFEPWTNLKAWNGQKVLADKAIK